MSKDEIIYEATEEKARGSNFLRIGKYFLIVFVFTIQAFLAYIITDKNYASIFNFVNSFTKEEMVVYTMDELIVNPAGSQGQRYLVVQATIELSESNHIDLVNQHSQRIKHYMNASLSSRTVDQLLDFNERERLRVELKNIVNREIGEYSVRNLYYTKYVMQ